MKKLFALLLALAVILTCFTACGGGKVTDGNAEPDAVPFPAFTSETIDGEAVTEDAFKGNKLTMVNIWGTFCSPCINEMPDLEKLSKDYAEKGVAVIGICADLYDYATQKNSESKINEAEDIIAYTGVTYMNIVPSDSLNEAKLNEINTFPTTYFINENGEIVGEYIGSRAYTEWSYIIDELLAK